MRASRVLDRVQWPQARRLALAALPRRARCACMLARTATRRTSGAGRPTTAPASSVNSTCARIKAAPSLPLDRSAQQARPPRRRRVRAPPAG